MTTNFIYVFSKKDRDSLSKLGYLLLKQDNENSIFVFVPNGTTTFDLSGISQYTISNILTF